MAADGRNIYLGKIGQIPSEMDARTYARMKNVMCDQLLATKTEIVQTYDVFSFCVQNQECFRVMFARQTLLLDIV